MDKLTTALFALILAASISSFAGAPINEEHTEAPEISAEVWINSPALTLSKLRGKVV